MRFITNLLVGTMILFAAMAVDYPIAEAEPGETVRINEIMYDPLMDEVGNEWVELYNYGNQPVNIKNWSLLDQDGDDLLLDEVDFRFPDMDFPSGGFALVHTGQGTNSTTFVDGKAHFYMWKSTSIWSPTVDDCLLANATDSTVDYVSYGLWDTSAPDPPPTDFTYSHVNSSAEEGFSAALVNGLLMESVPTPLEPNGPNTAPAILMTEVCYDTWGENEFVKLSNPTENTVDLSYWQLTDGEGVAFFPKGTEIAPGQTITVAQNSTNYHAALLEYPDYEYLDICPVAGEMGFVNYEPTMSNDGDELFLLNCFGTPIDCFVWGNSDYAGAGWDSEPAEDLKQGRIAKRACNGTYADTNTSADWLSLRPYVIGQSDFQPQTFQTDGPIRLFSSPDSSFKVICDELDNATESVDLNLYEFTNTQLADGLLAAILRGVQVRLFLEGYPVSGMNDTQLFIAREIAEAGGEVRIQTNDPGNDIHARYDFDHAKYAVVDNQTLIIMSENWGWTGVPPSGQWGNRGWGAAIHDTSTAQFFADVFQEDWNPLRADSVAFNSEHEDWNSGHDWSRNGTECTHHFSSVTIDSPSDIIPVLSPDTSLSNRTIFWMLESAQETVMVQQFYAYKHWGDRDSGSPEETPNQYLEAVIDAARRGCQVRVLLDSTYYNMEETDPIDNDDTVEYLNTIAVDEGLNMEAKLVNLSEHDYAKIHNKGMIVDDAVLISSINWNLNSVTENREAGIIIKNQEAADFFTGIFEYDWMDDTTPPLAQFSCNQSYRVNTTVNLSASSSFDNVGIVNYTWLLDTQPISWDENISHNFTDIGTCCLNLTVSDAWGNRGWTQKTINITAQDVEPSQEENPTNTSEPNDNNNTNDSGSADNGMSKTIAVLLLVPVFIIIAVFIFYWFKSR